MNMHYSLSNCSSAMSLPKILTLELLGSRRFATKKLPNSCVIGFEDPELCQRSPDLSRISHFVTASLEHFFLFKLLKIRSIILYSSPNSARLRLHNVPTRTNIEEAKGNYPLMFVWLFGFNDESSIWHLLFEATFTQSSMNAAMDSF